jgi:hypothetical protein
MNPVLSIIIPHKNTPMNDKALMLNLASLIDNTYYSFELIVDTECPKDPYKIWNEVSEHARGDILIFTNSDVIMGPGWDKPFALHIQDNAIVTGYLLEPGNVGVAAQNIQIDFGRNPDQFEMSLFEKWVLPRIDPTWVTEERGWYMPCAMKREWFMSTGGFDTTIGFPNPNDILFWERCVKEYNTKLLRVKSFSYHFQNLSGRS